MAEQSQNPNSDGPYKTYSLEEFYKLAKMGIWSGGNIQGIGFVRAGRAIPKYIQVYLSSRRDNKFVAKAGELGLYTGIVGGIVQNTKAGSVRMLKSGKFSPAYYKYLERSGKGWTGGSRAAIETFQMSSKGLRAAGEIFGGAAGAAGIGLSLYSGYKAIKNKDMIAFEKSGIDTVMGAVGFMCVPGFIISTLYFVIDPFGEKASTETENNAQAPIDNLRVNRKIMTLQEQMRIRQLNKIERVVIKRGFQ